MAKKTQDASPLSAFNGVIGNLSGNYSPDNNNVVNTTASSLDIDSMGVNDDDEVIDLSVKSKDDNADITPSAKDETDIELINDDVSNNNDDAEEDVDDLEDTPIKQTKKNKKDVNFSDEDDDDNDSTENAESSQVGLFFDAFSEALGWEVDDEEERPSTIESLIEYMQSVVEDNSVPDYANDQVKELDEYIKNGGKFDDYYKVNDAISDLNSIDMEDESNQKRVCKEWLKISGYTDNQINKKIQRWEDAGVLEDEANDSLELLSEHNAKNKEALLEEQKQTRIKQEQAQQEFYTDVITTIDNLKYIRDIKIPVEDRKKLKDYAFKIEADGTTKYQKEYAKNITKNFIESAYFTMKGDAFTKSAKQAGESSAVAKLRQTMKNRTPGNSKHNMDNSSAAPIWKAASSVFGVRS